MNGYVASDCKVEYRRIQNGRAYRTLLSGLERQRRFGAHVRIMTLTLKKGVVDKKRFARWFQTLRKRIEHEFRWRIEYCMVVVDDNDHKHAHILFTVRSLVSGVFLGIRSGFIPVEWLTSAWHDITKHSYVVYLQNLYNNPRNLARYFISQYVSAQGSGMRLSYSQNWVFRGFSKVWKKCFAPRYARAFFAGVGFDSVKATNVFNRVKARIIGDWHRVLGLDMFVLYKEFPFLRVVSNFSIVPLVAVPVVPVVGVPSVSFSDVRHKEVCVAGSVHPCTSCLKSDGCDRSFCERFSAWLRSGINGGSYHHLKGATSVLYKGFCDKAKRRHRFR